MRNGYRHPVASIVMMVLSFLGIALMLGRTGILVPIGSAVVLILAFTALIGVLVYALLFALHRSGTHRLANVRTWTQD